MAICYLRQDEFEIAGKVLFAVDGAQPVQLGISESSEQPGDKTLHIDALTMPRLAAFVQADGATAFSSESQCDFKIEADGASIGADIFDIGKAAGKKKWPDGQRVAVELDYQKKSITFRLEAEGSGIVLERYRFGKKSEKYFEIPTARKNLIIRPTWEALERLLRVIPATGARCNLRGAFVEPANASTVRLAATDGKVIYAHHVSSVTASSDASRHTIPSAAIALLRKIRTIWPKDGRPLPKVEIYHNKSGNADGQAYINSGRRGVRIAWAGLPSEFPDISGFLTQEVKIGDMRSREWIASNCDSALDDNQRYPQPQAKDLVPLAMLTDFGPISFSAFRLRKVMDFFDHGQYVRILIPKKMEIPPVETHPPRPIFFGPTAPGDYIGLVPLVVK